LCRGFFELVVW